MTKKNSNPSLMQEVRTELVGRRYAKRDVVNASVISALLTIVANLGVWVWFLAGRSL